MKRILTVVLAVMLCSALLLSGCGGKGIATKNDKELNATVVATFGDIKATQADYNFIYKIIYDNMAQYSAYYGEDWINTELEEGKTIGDYIKENTMNQLKQLSAAVILAEEKGIKVDSDIKDVVKEQKKQIIEENYQSEENYVKFLEQSRTTDKAIDKYLQMCEVYNRLFDKMTSSGGEAYIEDKAIEKEFLEAYSDKWRVQHILISTQEQTDEEGNVNPPRSDADAQKIVKEIIAKLDKGEDFDSLIEKYNEDPGMSKGSYYLFGAGEMVPEFEEASAKLKVGEYTKEGVKTDYGYHIIKKYEINTDIEEFKDFKNSKSEERVMEFVEKKMEKMKSKVQEKAIDKYVKAWIKELKAEAKAAQDAQQETQEDSETKTE